MLDPLQVIPLLMLVGDLGVRRVCVMAMNIFLKLSGLPAYSNKIVTSCASGDVLLWDITKTKLGLYLRDHSNQSSFLIAVY
jgi:hypothetical protein